MTFYPDEKDRPYREGLFTSRRFWLGAFVTFMALAIGMSAILLFRNWSP